jgi:hypothetical protein
LTKNWKKCTAEKKTKFFLHQKLQLTYPWASIKDVQVTKEAFSSQKRTSSTSKHQIFYFFSTFVGHFCPPGFRSESTDLIESGSNPDPKPWPPSPRNQSWKGGEPQAGAQLPQIPSIGTFKQCCGSVSGIKGFFNAWIRDGEKNQDPGSGSGIHYVHPGSYFREPSNNFLGQNY